MEALAWNSLYPHSTILPGSGADHLHLFACGLSFDAYVQKKAQLNLPLHARTKDRDKDKVWVSGRYQSVKPAFTL
jgi:hypothetical protein